MTPSEYHRHTVETMLSKPQFEQVSTTLSSLADKLRVGAVMLANSSGRVIAKNVRKDFKGDITLLSTLAASSYAAANEMARILDEDDNFKMVLHEGRKHNIYVSSVSDHFFLIIVFEKGVALGMVRLFTRKTIELLTPILQRRDTRQNLSELLGGSFESLLNDELDRSLTEFT
ncbi:roadblock/LC7 domain-containing protein [bacterium]|nr:roadblock/LC7 domain-containing protein [bacterium]